MTRMVFMTASAVSICLSPWIRDGVAQEPGEATAHDTARAGIALPAAWMARSRDVETLAFTHVTVVDVEKGERLEDHTVLIEGDRIRTVAPSLFVRVPPNASVVDATGRYLIPGLWDMHVHPDDPEVWELEPEPEQRDLLLPQFPLWGVTGVRDMGGAWSVIRDWRDRIAAGDLLGPRIVAAGPLIDGPEPMWPGSVAVADSAAAIWAVDSLLATGIDFLKVYSLLPRDAFFSLARQAGARDAVFAGHVPNGVDPLEAAEAGMNSLEHAVLFPRPLADLQAVRARVDRLGTEATSDERRSTFIRGIAGEYDADRARDLFQRLSELGTYVTPTLLVSRRNAWFDAGQADVVAQLPYMPAYIRRWWTPEQNVHLRDRTPESARDLQVLYATMARITAEMHAAGVRLLVGTDTGGNPHLFPGFTVHEEMEELVAAAGMSPAEALRAATLYPAAYLGLNDEIGTVAEGKRADLVLLDADPLENIRNTRAIAGVVVGGHWIDTLERRNRLADILRRATGDD